MNIFVLDRDIQKAARYHVNKHVVKQVLETAQMLSTAHWMIDGNLAHNQNFLYTKTHINHPCSVWVRKNTKNYMWTYEFFKALCFEYTYRYDKIHLSWKKLGNVLSHPPVGIDYAANMTPFAQAMPDKYKSDDAVEAYRNYYCAEKTHLFEWKYRDIPEWVKSNPYTIMNLLTDEETKETHRMADQLAQQTQPGVYN
jgi:hypothetical protein